MKPTKETTGGSTDALAEKTAGSRERADGGATAPAQQAAQALQKEFNGSLELESACVSESDASNCCPTAARASAP